MRANHAVLEVTLEQYNVEAYIVHCQWNSDDE